jgi:hypothetical protein
MGLGNLFGRKNIPDELPSLAVEGLSKSLNQEMEKYKPLPKLPMRPNLPSVNQPAEAPKTASIQVDEEQGYFKQLVKSVTEETGDLEKLDSWYKNKFLPGDMVFQMREYWEKQQPDLLLKNISGDLKNRLMEKTEYLHKLEKDWQEIYFHLLSKEEEIRKEEKALKESLSEFVELFRKSVAERNKTDELGLSKTK